MIFSYRKVMDFLFYPEKTQKNADFSHARTRAGLICQKTGVYFIINKKRKLLPEGIIP